MSSAYRRSLMRLVRRYQYRALLQGAGAGMLFGSLAAAGFVGLFTLGTVSWGLGAAGATLALGPVAGGIMGWVRRPVPAGVADLLDRAYALDGRLRSAWEFTSRGTSTRAQAVQVAEAERLLAEIDPRDVVPRRAPVLWHAGLAMTAAAGTMLGTALWGAGPERIAVEIAPPQSLPQPAARAEVDWLPAPAAELPADFVPTGPSSGSPSVHVPSTHEPLPTIPPAYAPVVRRYVAD